MSKGAFIIYGRREVGEPEGGQKFRDLLSWGGGGGGNFFCSILFGGEIFFNALFLLIFFHESDITCIITVVGAQQQHKGMFFLNMGGGQIFPTVSWGGGDFFPMYSRGGVLFFFFAYRFCRPPHPSPTAINNERSVISIKEVQ